MTTMTIEKFNSQMQEFKKHAKIIKEESPNFGYEVAQTFFTEVLDFDEEGIGLYGHAVMEFIMSGFLLDSCPKGVFIEETWKKTDRETYIERRHFASNSDKMTGIFNVWHRGKVIKVLFTFERNPYFMFPKRISLEQIMVVADCSEKTDDGHDKAV